MHDLGPAFLLRNAAETMQRVAQLGSYALLLSPTSPSQSQALQLQIASAAALNARDCCASQPGFAASCLRAMCKTMARALDYSAASHV